MKTSVERTLVLDKQKTGRKIERIAHQIYEQHHNHKQLVLVGIAQRGAQLAARLAVILNAISPMKVEVLSMEMDKESPSVEAIKLSGKLSVLEGQAVVLVDDVLNSGKTLMHAACYILQVPVKQLKTVVLVDRLHRSYPIRADIVGLTLSTTFQEHISVSLQAGKEGVYLSE